MQRPHEIDELSADGTLIIAILLYPKVIPLLAKKNTFDKVGNLQKSYFTQEQKQNWG